MKLLDRIRNHPGVSYCEKEVDQWVCYSHNDYWFPDLECQTCIDTNLRVVWDYVRSAEIKPTHYE
jgi:hypothetical protein